MGRQTVVPWLLVHCVGDQARVPRSKAEHMAAPTNAADAKITLANQEPSTFNTASWWQSSHTTHSDPTLRPHVGGRHRRAAVAKSGPAG